MNEQSQPEVNILALAREAKCVVDLGYTLRMTTLDYLARHVAHYEDDTPITPEWLVACGGEERFDQYRFGSHNSLAWLWLFPCKHEPTAWACEVGDGQYDYDRGYSVTGRIIRTRGDVRRLAREFGITLREEQ